MTRLYVKQGEEILVMDMVIPEAGMDPVEMVGGGTLLSEAEAREAFRNNIRQRVQYRLANLPSGANRSAVEAELASLPSEVRELVGENFLKSQIDIILTGPPSV